MLNYDLTDKARELLSLAAAGQGEEQGFIDDYRYRAGGTPIERPHDARSEADFREAMEQLVQRGFAERLRPQHMQGRRGLQLTAQGYRLAEHLDQ